MHIGVFFIDVQILFAIKIHSTMPYVQNQELSSQSVLFDLFANTCALILGVQIRFFSHQVFLLVVDFSKVIMLALLGLSSRATYCIQHQYISIFKSVNNRSIMHLMINVSLFLKVQTKSFQQSLSLARFFKLSPRKCFLYKQKTRLEYQLPQCLQQQNHVETYFCTKSMIK